METSIENSGRIGSIVTSLFSSLLERAAFYGIRGLLILYMTSGNLLLDQSHAYQIYSFFILIAAITPIIGGVIGDLVIAHRWSCLTGNIIQAAGALALCFDTSATLYIGLGLIALGNGFYKPNMMAKVGKVYLYNTKVLDSVYSIFMLAINIGAFIGTLLLATLSMQYGYRVAFGAAVVIMIFSGLLVAISEDIEDSAEATIENRPSADISALIVIGVLICAGLYWASYQISWTNFSIPATELFNSLDLKMNYYDVSSYMSIPMLAIAGIIWYYTHYNSLIKLITGVACGIIGTYLLFQVIQSEQLNMPIFLLIALLFSVAEVHLTTATISLVAKHMNSKFLAVGMATYTLVLFSISRILHVFSYYQWELNWQKLLALALSVVVLAILAVLYVLNQNSIRQKPEVPI